MPQNSKPKSVPNKKFLVECNIEIAASPGEVFKYLTDSKLLSEWLDAEALIEPHIGGKLRINFAKHHTIVEGRVLELVPDRKISFSWGVAKGNLASVMPMGSTTVIFTLMPLEQSTLLELKHIDLPDQELMKDHDEGWTNYLQALGDRLKVQ